MANKEIKMLHAKGGSVIVLPSEVETMKNRGWTIEGKNIKPINEVIEKKKSKS